LHGEPHLDDAAVPHLLVWEYADECEDFLTKAVVEGVLMRECS
jgi:hypothetical protein